MMHVKIVCNILTGNNLEIMGNIGGVVEIFSNNLKALIAIKCSSPSLEIRRR